MQAGTNNSSHEKPACIVALERLVFSPIKSRATFHHQALWSGDCPSTNSPHVSVQKVLRERQSASFKISTKTQPKLLKKMAEGHTAPGSIASTIETGTTPLAPSNNLVRSRSRYKAGRPNLFSIDTRDAPSVPQRTSRHSQEEPVSIRRRKAKAPVNLEVESAVEGGKARLRRASSPRISEYRKKDSNQDNQHEKLGIARSQSSISQSGQNEPASSRSYSGRGRPRLNDPVLEIRPSLNVTQESATRSLALPKKSLTQRITGQTYGHRHAKSRDDLKKKISAPIAIEPMVNAIVPAFDAPISAVNAGERRVKVKYGQATTSVPVTPFTTPIDIVHFIAEQTSDSIDLNTCVLLESFKMLGLERPLRRYEHVRDVLNSWDNDAQHYLLLISDGRDYDVELEDVPASQPGDTTAQLYHSQKPSQWDKRWVTLRSDGQVLLAKRDGGEASNICHISDFDIYIPTPRQLAKKIKPPRKLCFAVKSQQKSSMFISTANFVHFFSTSDRALGNVWYKAIQKWRSWYLVNVMGEGTGTIKTPAKPNFLKSGHISSSALQRTESIFMDPAKRGSETRLLGRPSTRTLPIRTQAPPPSSLPGTLIKDATRGIAPIRKQDPPLKQAASHDESKPTPFAVGLVGRTYTQRQEAQQGSNHRDETHNYTHIPSIKPLVDLTPQFQEPPQFARRGRGVTPKTIPSGGLVEAATSPEVAIPLPSATAVCQRPVTSGRSAAVDHSPAGTVRKDANGRLPSLTRHTSVSPNKGATACTNPLPAGNPSGQGGTRSGRGIMAGDR